MVFPIKNVVFIVKNPFFITSNDAIKNGSRLNRVEHTSKWSSLIAHLFRAVTTYPFFFLANFREVPKYFCMDNFHSGSHFPCRNSWIRLSQCFQSIIFQTFCVFHAVHFVHFSIIRMLAELISAQNSKKWKGTLWEILTLEMDSRTINQFMLKERYNGNSEINFHIQRKSDILYRPT